MCLVIHNKVGNGILEIDNAISERRQFVFVHCEVSIGRDNWGQIKASGDHIVYLFFNVGQTFCIRSLLYMPLKLCGGCPCWLCVPGLVVGVTPGFATMY